MKKIDTQKKVLLIAIAIQLIVLSCKTEKVTSVALQSTWISQYTIDDKLSTDSSIYSTIVPFKTKLDSGMNKVLGYSTQALYKATPEGLLGNFCADALLSYSKLFQKYNPDFALLNNGGLRAPLPQGAITVRNIFELMPFDNEIVILKIEPEIMERLLNHIVELGGIPVSMLSFEIDNNQKTPINIKINNQPYDKSKSYTLVTTDFIAGGGDRFPFNEGGVEMIKTGIKYREALIDYIDAYCADGRMISVEFGNRISNYKQ